MAQHLNKIYHKGRFRSRERDKHLGPFLKRVGNKRWRKTGKRLENVVDELPKQPSSKKRKKWLKVRITYTFWGASFTYSKKYRSLKDAQKAINRHNVIDSYIYNEE